MTLENIMTGLAILRTYYSRDGWYVGAENGQLCLAVTHHPVSADDVKKLRGIGWYQSGVNEDDYDAEVPWVCFV